MKWKVLFLCAAVLMLAGCGKKEEVKVEETVIAEGVEEVTELRDGNHISAELAEGVQIDAEISLPKDWAGTVETCRVQRVPFDGEQLSKTLFPEVTEWETDSDGAWGTTVNDKEKMIGIGDAINYCTYNWWEQEGLFSIPGNAGDYMATPSQKNDEFSYATREAIANEAEKCLTEKVGLEQVQIDQIYAVSREEIYEEYQRRQADTEGDLGKEDNGLTPERNSVEDFNDCYWIHVTRCVNGLPLFSGGIFREDGAHIPSGRITMGYTEHGLEGLNVEAEYKVLEKTEEELYDFVPVWEFASTQDSWVERFYVDARIGKEMIF